ncbi:MAG TPA: hypothetical protein VEV13_01435 [Candidatus Limnocylindria bacterium]|nr:hypothetical protein [Candidatus Limnocylindria bacterium]
MSAGLLLLVKGFRTFLAWAVLVIPFSIVVAGRRSRAASRSEDQRPDAQGSFADHLLPA